MYIKNLDKITLNDFLQKEIYDLIVKTNKEEKIFFIKFYKNELLWTDIFGIIIYDKDENEIIKYEFKIENATEEKILDKITKFMSSLLFKEEFWKKTWLYNITELYIEIYNNTNSNRIEWYLKNLKNIIYEYDWKNYFTWKEPFDEDYGEDWDYDENDVYCYKKEVLYSEVFNLILIWKHTKEATLEIKVVISFCGYCDKIDCDNDDYIEDAKDGLFEYRKNKNIDVVDNYYIENVIIEYDWKNYNLVDFIEKYKEEYQKFILDLW